ncbi:thioredoxin domain-containing protein [Oscillospiraceae bacterium LTW-04]|nr:thioredoxin domain-containing protein [Oscillospiraceae bacterium MB24-C1]
MNHLKSEKSPYLLQHVNNPVDWYPWGKVAFDKAKSEDKPVFLSIGYSTCHWCHVMAHESFEDAEVAAILNRDFISIKVDREERPDVDAVYMSVCQALTGSGGWPLTVMLTPEQKPFWAGTYLPKNSRYGMPGLMDLLAAVMQQWHTGRELLLKSGEQIVLLLQSQEQSAQPGDPDKALLTRAFEQFKRGYDSRWGGFGSAPKFPTAHNLLFLLRYSVLLDDESANKMALHTLAQMYRGGMFDHIGGGFSRYSTDEKWLVPHFEKMLYDNALLSCAYLEAYQMTGKALCKTVVTRTLDYVLRELTDTQGGFYCGQDADSDGVEGKYYVFSPEEIISVLGEADGKRFCEWFGVTKQGNFEGLSILNLIENRRFEESDGQIEYLSRKLYDYRLSRVSLHKDDKVLTAWNGLMIAALARAGWLLNEAKYLNAAIKAQHFITKYLTDANGRLRLRWRDGESAHDGQLDDYAFYALALLALYQATFDAGYLSAAITTTEQMLTLFSDDTNGGFYRSASDAEQLIARTKEIYDGALPSGNSVAALVLCRIAALTGEAKWQQAADRQLRFVCGALSEYPAGHCVSLLALMTALFPGQELICTAADENGTEGILGFLRETPVWNLTVLVKTISNQHALEQVAPFTADYPLPEQGCAYYLCRNKACAAPVYSLAELKNLLLKL